MFTIKGKAPNTGLVEVIDTFETRKEALTALQEYRLAFGVAYSLWVIDPRGDRLFE